MDSNRLTTTEAARALGISRWTLLRRVRDGKIKPVGPGNPVLQRQRLSFDRGEIERVKREAGDASKR